MTPKKKPSQAESWVVYQSAVRGEPTGPNAVCEQAEWEAMEAQAPGANRLIQAGIRTEGEAERLARGKSGDPVPRAPKGTTRFAPDDPASPPQGV
jgi:hypothetical protein